MDMDKTAIGTLDEEKTQAVPTPQGDATQMAMNVECPVCRTPNPPAETYCIDCGFLLSQEEVAAVEMPEQPSMGKLVTPDGVREFPLNPGENTVGRENADILLSHNTVSRKHATVTVEEGKAFVEDAGSTNGTYVAGKKLSADEKAELNDGCDVVFGSFSLKYQAPAEAEEQKAESEEPGESEELASDSSILSESKGADVAEAEVTAEEPEAAAEASETAPVGTLQSKDGSITFDIHEGTNTIGRREGDNEIVIPDPYCSGRHAELTYEDGKFTLTDIGSTNGTSVNGQKLDPNAPRELSTGDEITLGQTVYRVTLSETRHPDPESGPGDSGSPTDAARHPELDSGSTEEVE